MSSSRVLSITAYVNAVLIAMLVYAALTGFNVWSFVSHRQLLGGVLLVGYILVSLVAWSVLTRRATVPVAEDRLWAVGASLLAVVIVPLSIRTSQSDWWAVGEVLRFYGAPWALGASTVLTIIAVIIVARRSSENTPQESRTRELVIRAGLSFGTGIAVYLTRQMWPQPLEQLIVTWLALVLPAFWLLSATVGRLGEIARRHNAIGP